MKKDMRIFLLTPWKPAKDGLRHYSEELFSSFKINFPLLKLTVIPWNYTKKSKRLLSPMKDYARHLLSAFHLDVLHIQYIAGLYLWHLFPLLITTKLLGKKVIFTLHELNDNATGKLLLNWIQTLYLLFADALIVHTEFHKQALPHRLQRKTRVIPHASPDLQTIYNITPHPQTLLLAGFINPWKGYDLAIEAFAQIANDLPNLSMIIVGKAHDAACADALKKQIIKAGLEHRITLLTEFIPKEELEKNFCQADAVLLPYRRITMSGILANAIGARRPMIMTRLKPFVEHTMNTSLYFEKEDASDLAQKIVSLMTDRDLHKAQEQSAQELYEYYSLKRVTQLTKHLYDQLV
jgi:D-inositol-3-phosphate glycosyltransferase